MFWPADCTNLPELVQKFLSLPHSVFQATRLQRVLHLPRYNDLKAAKAKNTFEVSSQAMSALCRLCAAGERASACTLHDRRIYVSPHGNCLRRLHSCFHGAKCISLCRSPSVVIGYLMRLRRWRLNESYKWVHDRRAVVSLHEGDA